MAISFPGSPDVNDTYQVGNTTYTWTGVKWRAGPVALADVALSGDYDDLSDRPTLAVVPIDQLAGIAPTLDLDFARQVYRHYSPGTGLQAKALADIVTFTRASSATYFDATGVMRTAASDEPRIEYDPVSGECLGLLIEAASTNLLTYSEQFDNAAWTKTRSSISANASTAPDGTLTADKLIEDSSASTTHFAYKSASCTSGTTYTGSFFAKAGERNTLNPSLTLAFPAGVSAIFNLATGVATPGAAATASMTAVGGGWYRCAFSAIANSTTTANFALYLYSGSVSYTGNGTSGLYIWGAQLEAGSAPSSYIPTTTATATRAAETAVIDGSAFSDCYHSAGEQYTHHASAGLAHDTSPALSDFDLATEPSDHLRRLVFFPRELAAPVLTALEEALDA